EYKNITYGAQGRFERADWLGVQAAMRQRLDLYKQKVIIVADSVHAITGKNLQDRELWRLAKAEYAGIIQGHRNFEITQTFFNSVYCYVFGHEKIRDLHAFVMEPAQQSVNIPAENILLCYPCQDNFPEIFSQILDNCDFNIPFEDKQRD